MPRIEDAVCCIESRSPGREPVPRLERLQPNARASILVAALAEAIRQVLAEDWWTIWGASGRADRPCPGGVRALRAVRRSCCSHQADFGAICCRPRLCPNT